MANCKCSLRSLFKGINDHSTSDDYYNPRFHFCQPEGRPRKEPESLWSVLFGDIIFNSAFDVSSCLSVCLRACSDASHIRMLEYKGTCRTFGMEQVPAEDAKFINDRIREDYALNWLIDGLPAAEMKLDLRTGDLFFDMGFNLGNDEDEEFIETPALNNHYEIVLRCVSKVFCMSDIFSSARNRYHTPSPGVHRVVGVLVWPTRYYSPPFTLRTF